MVIRTKQCAHVGFPHGIELGVEGLSDDGAQFALWPADVGRAGQSARPGPRPPTRTTWCQRMARPRGRSEPTPPRGLPGPRPRPRHSQELRRAPPPLENGAGPRTVARTGAPPPLCCDKLPTTLARKPPAITAAHVPKTRPTASVRTSEWPGSLSQSGRGSECQFPLIHLKCVIIVATLTA